MIPLRGCGGNVLLRRVYEDTSSLWTLQQDPGVVQIGEIVGLGSRWTQQGKWSPPISIQGQRQRHLDNDNLYLWDKMEDEDGVQEVFDPLRGHRDPDWKPTHVEERPRVEAPIFSGELERAIAELRPGDLVLFNNARVYEVFKYDGKDILVYPGNWILAVMTNNHHLVRNPSVRRYAPEPA
jgi:hypothetical protein